MGEKYYGRIKIEFMNNERYSIFFKAMMTGLFIGIVDTVICLCFNIGYRNVTGYTPSALINVSSLIFAVNLLLLVIGIIYFLFLLAFKKGDIFFIVVFVGLTILSIVKTEGLTRFADPKLDNGFRGLLGGIIFILGLSASCLPFFFHSRKFQESVL
jgi:hypothetical protein